MKNRVASTASQDPAISRAPCAAIASIAALAVAALAGPMASAQQSVPFANGIPVAPELEVPPIPTKPKTYDTAEGMEIRVVVVARHLANPYSVAFLPGNVMLVTEKDGKLRVIRDGKLDPNPAPGIPEVKANRRSGLNDIALHPNFAENHYVYFTYHKPLPNDEGEMALARGRWNGTGLEGTEDLFVTGPGAGDRSRMIFGPDGTIYMSTAGNDPQDPNTYGGKILRLTDEGGVPADNPFVGLDGYKPEIFTLGHRTTLGLAVRPGTGEIWQAENGPNGGDEVNVLKPGANYGWPLISLGRDYQGAWHSQRWQAAGFEDPIVYWTPSIAISGMTFYTGDKLPKWKGDLFVGSLRTGEIIGTGHIERVLFNENMQELRREALLRDWRHRMRDIRQGPDGYLYVLIDDPDGALIRIEPANGG
jgi:glucose/arabinose dehydrogenase